MIIGLIILFGTLIYIGYYCYRIDSYEHWSPSEEDIKHERKIMLLEKNHYGRYLMHYETQNKEYQQWRKEAEQLLKEEKQ